MFFAAVRFFRLLLSCAIYLAITGEIYSATLDMKGKAHKSVTHGLMSIKALNVELHK